MESNTSVPKLSPAFFFLSVGMLVTLITSVTAFLNLVFATLDKEFPDVLSAVYQYGYNSYNYDGIRSALATLIIMFPILLVVSRFWKKYTIGSMGRIDEIIRKWIIYLVVFLSGLVVAIDLVMLVRYFIAGEITTRFLLKVLVALVTAGLVGIYYIFELRSKEIKSHAGLAFSLIGSALVIGAVVYSFAIMGSPFKQRQLRLDDRRVQDLQSIQGQVISYWQQKEKLPSKLSDLSNPLSGYSLPVDPEFELGRTYEYNVKSPLSFELCATFSLPMPKGWQEYSGGRGVLPMPAVMEGGATTSAVYPYPGYGANESWDHDAGRTCFSRTIDKDLYPPFPKAAVQ